MYQRANFKLGLERAVIGKGGYDQTGGGAAAEAKPEQSTKLKAAEIEELLKHGAQARSTPAEPRPNPDPTLTLTLTLTLPLTRRSSRRSTTRRSSASPPRASSRPSALTLTQP